MKKGVKKIDEIIDSFSQLSIARGFDIKPRGGLISPYFENDFNLSSGHQYVQPIILSSEKVEPYKIAVDEPCFRRADISKIGYSLYHLLLFEMGVIGILGYTSQRAVWLREVLQFSAEWLHSLGLEIGELFFTISSGVKIHGKSFKKDNDSYAALRSMGISEKNIIWTKGRRNFIYSRGHNRPAGYGIEIYCPTKNGAFVEIASPIIYTDIYKDGFFEEALNSAVGVGFGFERISYVINSYDNIFQTDIYSRFIALVRQYFDKEVDFQLIQSRLYTIGELLRALVFIISDGQLSGQGGRGKIMRNLIKSLFSEINYVGLPTEEIVIKGVRTFIETYSQRYPEMKSEEDLIKRTIFNLEKVEEGVTLD